LFPDYKYPEKLLSGIDVLGSGRDNDPKLIFDYFIIKVIFTGDNEFFYEQLIFQQ
jgi:hypothetical protein